MMDLFRRIMPRTGIVTRYATRQPAKRVAPPRVTGIETLEDRQLLSASGKPSQHEQMSVHVPERIAKILNGIPTNGFASVGLLGDVTGNYCSGTLIDSQWVLTAAHCSVNVADGDGRFTVGGKIYSTEQIFIHPDYRPKRFNSNQANDIALWKLSEPVVGVDPSPIFREVPQVGTLLTLVGFGYGGTLAGEDHIYGTKRQGTTPLEKVTSTRIRWVFDSPDEANTGNGDSGGPAFIKVDDTFYVAGVTSGGTRKNAGRGDRAFDTRVDTYQNWIDNVMIGSFDATTPRRKGPRATRHETHSHANHAQQDAVMVDIAQHL